MSPGSSHRGIEPNVERVPVAGGELHAEAAGEGTPVVFIHSVIADGRMWDAEFERFSKHHRVVRYHLRGFGDSTPADGPFSYVADLGAVVHHFHLDRPTIVGSSMGGAFAIDYAIAHPGQVRGLFLSAPGLSGGLEPPYSPEEKSAFEEDDRKSRAIGEAYSAGDRATAFELLRSMWCPALSGANLALFRRMIEENSAEVYESRSQAKAESPPPPTAHLGKISVPTTVVGGGRDNPAQEPFVRRIAAAIPGSRLVVVPEADHLVNLSAPDRFAAELERALRGSG